MNEVTGVRKKLCRILGQDLPDYVWNLEALQELAKEYTDRKDPGERDESWSLLVEVARERLGIWNESRTKYLQGIQSDSRGGSRDMREAASRDVGGVRNLDTRELVGDRTKAMTEAMSACFALLGGQIPEVKTFREKVLPGRFLAADEAHALIGSYAARIFDLRLFEKWNIPVVGHDSKIVKHDTGSDRGGIYMRATVQIDPPGITKTVRYADVNNSLTEEDVADTRAVFRKGAAIPFISGLPVGLHGDYVYPNWLWPGSVVDKLYDLSVELAGAFDWPLASAGNLAGTRPRSETAAWFILTNEAPQVRPIEARWEAKRGSTHLNPQWRIQLTIPPWLPEEEVLQAFRALRRQRPKGRQMPKTAKPLEVARFVYERDREDYRETPPWTAWLKQWNEKHPGHRINTASNFRTYFLRGDAAVTHLNFDWPRSRHSRRSSDTT